MGITSIGCKNEWLVRLGSHKNRGFGEVFFQGFKSSLTLISPFKGLGFPDEIS